MAEMVFCGSVLPGTGEGNIWNNRGDAEQKINQNIEWESGEVNFIR